MKYSLHQFLFKAFITGFIRGRTVYMFSAKNLLEPNSRYIDDKSLITVKSSE